MTRVRLSMPDVDPILDRTERSLVERALAWLRQTRPRDSAILWNQVKRVALLGGVLEQTPSPLLPTSLGATARDARAWVAELSHLDPMSGDLALPEKAHVARAFLFAKLALLRAFRTALSPGAAGGEPGLWREVHGEFAQSIYTLIATEILIGLLSEDGVPERSKRRAAHQLMLIWDRAAQLEIDDFCPLLEEAWRARARVQVRFGALLGVGEYMRLVQSDCPSEFLDFFARDDVSDAEVQAFEEFLFNLPHEDLSRLRASMPPGGGVVSPDDAARILGRPLEESTTVDDPEALYRSFRRRRIAAAFRQTSRAPGPHCTAEAFIMLHVLDGWTSTATSEFPATPVKRGE